ncbi:hypothetical protein LIER_20008 [Lithospermum erythrorhizon]|uniref:Uncharacterized protein n=1 Tax=Lithospermum erythrorhizon TaxID=34254 RepID=A0AAV3QJW4_LITER
MIQENRSSVNHYAGNQMLVSPKSSAFDQENGYLTFLDLKRFSCQRLQSNPKKLRRKPNTETSRRPSPAAAWPEAANQHPNPLLLLLRRL